MSGQVHGLGEQGPLRPEISGCGARARWFVLVIFWQFYYQFFFGDITCQSTRIHIRSHRDLHQVLSSTDNAKLLQTGEHCDAGICDTYRSRLLFLTAWHEKHLSPTRYPSLFVLNATSSDNTGTTDNASIARTTMTISTSIPWTCIPYTSPLWLSFLYMESVFGEKRFVGQGQSDRTFLVLLRNKDWYVEVRRSYSHGLGCIFAL